MAIIMLLIVAILCGTAIRNPDPQYRVLVNKTERQLYLHRIDHGAEQLIKVYRIVLGSRPVGTEYDHACFESADAMG